MMPSIAWVSHQRMAAYVCLAVFAGCGEASKFPPLAAMTPSSLLENGSQRAHLPKEKVLWSFTGGSDGANPISGVIADAAGNLYGGTIDGADYKGTVFELIPAGSTYRETTLVTFTGRNGDAETGTPAMDSSGTLFGTTLYGGPHGRRYGGRGTVFRVSTKGKIHERVIWTFGGYRADGIYPDAGPVLAADGAVYGTTTYGGSFGYGTAFKLTPSARRYTETILHNFGGGRDGRYPASALTLGPGGVLYGTTSGGGSGCTDGCGIVFELTPTVAGYSENILWNFRGGADGSGPSSALTLDSSGDLYGVTYFGGGGGSCDSGAGYGCGTVYELESSLSGYTERVLWSFGKGMDGYYPLSNVVRGRNGRLYGTTQQGGTHWPEFFTSCCRRKAGMTKRCHGISATAPPAVTIPRGTSLPTRSTGSTGRPTWAVRRSSRGHGVSLHPVIVI